MTMPGFQDLLIFVIMRSINNGPLTAKSRIFSMDKPPAKLQEKNKKARLIVFDLDGTLAESKSDLDTEMAELLKKLLEKKLVAVIGGGGYEQFQKQFLSQLNARKELLNNIFLFPTTATTFYRYMNGGWREVYAEKLTSKEKKQIREAFKIALKEVGQAKPPKIYGKQLEDRVTQMSFSALGQDVVKVLGKKGVELKKKWRDENQEFKLKLAQTVQKLLPKLEVKAAGYTTIDITRKGIDKEYGMRQIKKLLGIKFNEMLFIGDSLFPGGNDYAAIKTGVTCIGVNGPEDTKKIIKNLLN